MPTSQLDARLAELGLVVPATSKPVAAYLPAVASGNLVYTSGQLPMVDGVLPATGKVGVGGGAGGGAGGGESFVSPEDAQRFARQCVLNGLAAARTAIGSLDRITRVVKVVGFVASDPEFTGQPGVINGASELLGEIFGDAGQHARSAVGVAVLPLDSPVEIEFVFEFA